MLAEKKMPFIVYLCYDVFLEVLQNGKRRQLAMLEAVGRRFHHAIDGNFEKTPFLIMMIKFWL